MTDDDALHAFMKSYQDRYGIPPLLDEMTERFATLSHRSSAFYAVRRLIAAGKVQVVGEPMTQRRYRAL